MFRLQNPRKSRMIRAGKKKSRSLASVVSGQLKNFLLGLVPEKQDYSANKPSELRKMVSAKLKKTRSSRKFEKWQRQGLTRSNLRQWSRKSCPRRPLDLSQSSNQEERQSWRKTWKTVRRCLRDVLPSMSTVKKVSHDQVNSIGWISSVLLSILLIKDFS